MSWPLGGSRSDLEGWVSLLPRQPLVEDGRMDQSRDVPAFRRAVAALVRAVLADLDLKGSDPMIEPAPLRRGWRREGQEIFIWDRRKTWSPPNGVGQVGGLDRFREMTDVRRVVEGHRTLRGRVDTAVGPGFSMIDRRLECLLFSELIYPLVCDLLSYRFDVDAFDQYYTRLEQGLLAEEMRWVDYVPISGLAVEAGVDQIDLHEAGFVLAPMTEAQIGYALDSAAVPVEGNLSPVAVQVSRLNQWALSRTTTHQIRYGYDVPPDGTPPSADDLADEQRRLVTALRVVGGGSVTTTRRLGAQHEDDFPIFTGAQTTLQRVVPVDLQRPCELTRDRVEIFVEVFGSLGRRDTRADRVLGIALRRLVFAGERGTPVDRLIDLMIAAEAFFLKRNGIKSNAKGEPAAKEAARLLGDDPDLRTELGPDAEISSAVRALLGSCYGRRNAEMHADEDPTKATVTRLDGTAAADLGGGVEDLDRVLRLAFQRTLSD
jgi:hypothetical protein